MRLLSFALISSLALAGCTAPPSSPMEKHARLAVGAELAAKRCAGYVGGYEGVQRMRDDSNRNIATARSLGATDAVIKKARSDVSNTFNTSVAFTSPQEACNSLVGSLAWVTQ